MIHRFLVRMGCLLLGHRIAINNEIFSRVLTPHQPIVVSGLCLRCRRYVRIEVQSVKTTR